MSFSATPLGQGRRLDHQTFLNKPKSSSSRPLSANGQSYIGAPLGSRSPPYNSSFSQEKSIPSLNNTEEFALERNSRVKEREQARPPTSHGPKIINSPPNNEKWSVKDTSVLIASAFHQAASDMQHPTPNEAWASGLTNNNSLHRSTSVEYEHSIHHRRVPAGSGATSKPSSKRVSTRRNPDPETEDSSLEHSRAKSPIEQAVDVAKRTLAPAAFYLRQRTPDGDRPSTNGANGSYDYSDEEREYQAAQNPAHGSPRRASAASKRNRISLDNKAYRPSKSDLEESEGDDDDDKKGRRRRRKKKNEPLGGPLTSLPVTSYDKKKKRSKKTNADGEEESGSEGQTSDQNSAELQERSAPPSRIGPRSAPTSKVGAPHSKVGGHLAPASRIGSAPTSRVESQPMPAFQEPHNHEDSLDIEQGLETIPEIEEPPPSSKVVERQKSQPFSIGGALGTMVYSVHFSIVRLLRFLWRAVSVLLFLVGRVIGNALDFIFVAPFRWLSGPRSSVGLVLRYFVLICTLCAVWYFLRDSIPVQIPALPSFPLGLGTSYHVPNIPPANIAELSIRLQKLEAALSGLSQDPVRSTPRYDTSAKTHDELVAKVRSLESQVLKEALRAAEAEREVKQAATQGLEAVKQEIEILHAQIQSGVSQPSDSGTDFNDEDARAKLKALTERVGLVEGDIKEALEMGKNVGKPSSGAAWWNLLGSSGPKSELMIKSSDGQDVTMLIGHMVDMAVGRYSKDTLARPDFALHSGGAMVIPSLTSPTFEVKPQNIRSQLVGLLTGNGYAIGRPPVTALHHELHNGHCWPFGGKEGQLGVMLAAPVYISDISIDHVAREVAFDMRSAPKDMEVWGLVEGKDNIARVKAWLASRAQTRKELEAQGLEIPEDLKEVPYPRTLPKSPQYIRLAKVTYDIHAPNNVQSFAISQEIQDLNVDFGIVVLRVRSNWGREDFTCLYRLRIHGQRMGDAPLP